MSITGLEPTPFSGPWLLIAHARTHAARADPAGTGEFRIPQEMVDAGTFRAQRPGIDRFNLEEFFFDPSNTRAVTSSTFGPSEYGSVAYQWKMCWDEGAHGGCPDLRRFTSIRNPFTGLPIAWEDPYEAWTAFALWNNTVRSLAITSRP